MARHTEGRVVPSRGESMVLKPFTITTLTAVIIVSIQGCSSETAKRMAFETLQNMREQECTRDLSGKCPARESYADYQRKRREAQSPE
jgi:hypothetical protein